MGVSNIWQLRRQPARLSGLGKLLWWAMVPLRLAKSLSHDLLRFNFASRPITFVPGTFRPSDGILAARLGWNKTALVEGPHLAQYEQAFADYLGVERAVSFGAARVALNALLKAMDIGPGDEVILPAYTCVVVPNAIRYIGARPVYVDIDSETYNLSVETVAPKITERTKAILAQHTFGLPVDLDPLLELARQHKIMVIEDCAGALGGSYKGRKLGTLGDAAFFSTEHSKVISTETGGMAVSTNSALLERLVAIQEKYIYPTVEQTRRLLFQFASTALFLNPASQWWGHMIYTLGEEWFNFEPSTSALECRGGLPDSYYRRLSNAQARLGLRQLGELDQNVAARRKAAQIYDQVLPQLGFQPPRIVEGACPAFLRYPFSVPDRDSLVKFGVEHKMEIGIWFASVAHPPSTQLDKIGYQPGSCPIAERAAQTTVNLPTHPLLKSSDVERIIEVLRKFSARTGTGREEKPKPS
ncbi:MAG: DegT/DnrJ/EryC1/StrS family aminotransferase [Chloroflexi bacterium]|nr:DegT/DnrJ/EryC1/StrS family aminotransferase [Chloroflexota bacterium]